MNILALISIYKKILKSTIEQLDAFESGANTTDSPYRTTFMVGFIKGKIDVLETIIANLEAIENDEI